MNEEKDLEGHMRFQIVTSFYKKIPEKKYILY